MHFKFNRDLITFNDFVDMNYNEFTLDMLADEKKIINEALCGKYLNKTISDVDEDA